MKKFFLLSILLFSYLYSFSESKDTSYLKIIFAGDIMGHDLQIESAYEDSLKGYNYEPTFRYLKPYLMSADIALGNLEVTLGGEPYKGYPQFSSPDSLAVEAKKAGFDILVTANNHSLDRRADGLKRTIDVLDAKKIIHSGTFTDENSKNLTYPLIIEKNNIRLAILNYTFSTNGISVPPPSIVNRIDTLQIRKDIHKAELASSDFIIVTIHWGTEYKLNENSYQSKLAEFILNAGADIIIGSHPHVVQPIKKYYPSSKDSIQYKLIVYSLGNLVSNMTSRYKNGGILFELVLNKIGEKTCIDDYSYLPVWVYRDDRGQKPTFYILPPTFFYKNEDFFGLTDLDKRKLRIFYNDTRIQLSEIKENSFYNTFSIKNR